ncbi:DUF309 domain-containing protein [filamentous cyanobacterium LEGE 11480]|uniref:DUF309 domain-containing protein n=1 Tax=Romeriopsis navalis LEGE 11480 TaxID=2777977 RepID=A0A928VSX0_9CYAN|nr:DUF309 domain-containing protein [Romeriopsis navalis]MBE9031494.1 DUF309 domain-containing protein [Romeriopsis navalis LEGE 11480]
MDESLPPEFWQGINEFNQGEFYACHDTLEAIWIPSVGPEKQLYQGIIQIAVAIYHLSNQNWRGTVILMGEGLNRLRHYPDEFAELDIGQFREEIAELLEILQNLGAERIADFRWASTADTITNQHQTNDDNGQKVMRPRPIIQKAIPSLEN